MSLYDIYSRWVHEKITDDEAAKLFSLTSKDFRFRVTRYGKRLPVVLKTLDRIASDQITREDAAKLLKVSARRVNQLELNWGVARPIKQYIINKAVTSVKWEIRKKFAIEYISGSATLEEAAENANVTDRQIRRWVSDLLEKHFGMVFKDLKDLTSAKRLRLADEIEEAEGLEISKINVLNEVSKGLKAIEEVAMERVLSKRTNRKTTHVRRIGPT